MTTLRPKDPRDVGPDARAKQHSVTLPIWLWKRIDEIAETLQYTRNEAIKAVLRDWVEESEAKALKKAK